MTFWQEIITLTRPIPRGSKFVAQISPLLIFLGKNPVCVYPKLQCNDEQLLEIVDFAFQSTKLVISQEFQVDFERIQMLEVLNDVIKTVSLTKFFGNFFGFLS